MPGRRNRSESRSRSRSRDSSYGGEETRVHIADVSVNCSKRELEDEFKKFGPLSEIWMARTPPCFAFAVYRNREDAEDAVRGMNGAYVTNRILFHICFILFIFILNTVFVSKPYVHRDHDGTQIIAGSVNMYRIFIRHNQESNP